MSWQVVFHDDFEMEFGLLAAAVQDELLAHAILLRDYGPGLGRPTIDTLKGSKHSNMKELRFRRGGEVWRVAFAFDPLRQAVLLVAGDKAGSDQTLVLQAFDRESRHEACAASVRIEYSTQGEVPWKKNSMMF